MKLSEILDDYKPDTKQQVDENGVNIKTIKKWLNSFSKASILDESTIMNEGTVSIKASKFSASAIRKQLNESGFDLKWDGGENYHFKYDTGIVSSIPAIGKFVTEADEEEEDAEQEEPKSDPADSPDVVEIELDGKPIWFQMIDSSHVKMFKSENKLRDGNVPTIHIRQLSHMPFYNDLANWFKEDDSSLINGNSYSFKRKDETKSYNKFINSIRENLDVPFVAIDENRNNVSVKISLDPIKSNSYLTSRYMIFNINENGDMIQSDVSSKLKEYVSFDPVNIDNGKEVAEIINNIVESVNDILHNTFSVGKSVLIQNATKYNSLSKSIVEGKIEGVDAYGKVIVSTKHDDYVVEQSDIKLKETDEVCELCNETLDESTYLGFAFVDRPVNIKGSDGKYHIVTVSVPKNSKVHKKYKEYASTQTPLGDLFTNMVIKVPENSVDEIVQNLRKYKVVVSIEGALAESDDNPCWDGYDMVGMKTKNGKEVPNCVPVSEIAKKVHERAISRLSEASNEDSGK